VCSKNTINSSSANITQSLKINIILHSSAVQKGKNRKHFHGTGGSVDTGMLETNEKQNLCSGSSDIDHEDLVIGKFGAHQFTSDENCESKVEMFSDPFKTPGKPLKH